MSVTVDAGIEIDLVDLIRMIRKHCRRYLEQNKERIARNDERLIEISLKTTIKMVTKFGTKITNCKKLKENDVVLS